MCRVENEALSHIVSECKTLAQKEYKRGMTMYAGIFTGNYAKNMTFKEYNSGTSMSQMESLRKTVQDPVEFYNPVGYQD